MCHDRFENFNGPVGSIAPRTFHLSCKFSVDLRVCGVSKNRAYTKPSFFPDSLQHWGSSRPSAEFVELGEG